MIRNLLRNLKPTHKMSKLTFETDVFRCHLRCDTCTYVKADGHRCKNRVCIGYPMCWIHTKKEYGLRVKDSTVEGAGKGLFTLNGAENGEWICPYVGDEISQECLDTRYPDPEQTAPYAVQNEDFIYEESYVDSACVRGVGSMANGLFRRDGRPRAVSLHNAEIEYRIDAKGLWLKARKDIEEGGEILVHYGDEYRLVDDHITRRRRGDDTRPC